MPVALRALRDDDLPFVYKTWLDHYRQCSPTTRHIASDVFYPEQHALIERLLKSCVTVVATPADDDSGQTILGYAVGERDSATLHWVYVKGPYRRFGVMGQMLSGADLNTFTLTHWTNDCVWLAARYPGLRYNPYLLQQT